MDVTTPTDPSTPGPDDRDLEDGGLDLSPRTGVAPPRRLGGGRRWGALALLAALAIAVVVVVIQARGATLYYKNADEAVAQKATLGTSRFRLQGLVEGTPVRGEGSEPTRFTVSYHGVTVDVEHTGSEPALFKAGLPVVVEGHWNRAGTVFESSRLLVKHTEDYQDKDEDPEQYQEEHPDRVEAEEQAQGAL